MPGLRLMSDRRRCGLPPFYPVSALPSSARRHFANQRRLPYNHRIMAATKIIGVDFSGAETNNSTWITQAILDGNCLLVSRCWRPHRQRGGAHQRLENLLLNLPSSAVAAMDFPFSVPQLFARKLANDAATMTDVWCAVAAENMRYPKFGELRDQFVKRHGETMRRGDRYFGGPISPLKTGGPNMLPMTFYGMQMLHRLWNSNRSFRVPPLPMDVRTGPVLLETMPGVLLRIFGLPAENYKYRNKSNGHDPEKVRHTILNGLPSRVKDTAGLYLVILDQQRQDCIGNADCLDSLVAAIGAAMWAKSPQAFLHPKDDGAPDGELQIARLEGWIYAPRCYRKNE